MPLRIFAKQAPICYFIGYVKVYLYVAERSRTPHAKNLNYNLMFIL
jgi:hypothetical protein